MKKKQSPADPAGLLTEGAETAAPRLYMTMFNENDEQITTMDLENGYLNYSPNTDDSDDGDTVAVYQFMGYAKVSKKITTKLNPVTR